MSVVEPPVLHSQGEPPEGFYSKNDVLKAIPGLTYRQLDYWATTYLRKPFIGSGMLRLYTWPEILLLKRLKMAADLRKLPLDLMAARLEEGGYAQAPATD